MNNKQQLLKLFKTKEDAIRDEMKELKTLCKLDSIEEYRNFNNVFIMSVKTYRNIFENSNIYSSEKDKYYIKDTEITKYEFLEILEVISDIKVFINEMIDKFSQKSKEILLMRNHNDVLKPLDAKQYKYTQQIIDDYIKLLY